jgi:sensor histidine kinase YesM
MNLYLTTEKLRFGDRLRLEFAVEERALEALVPSLLLQPLIENAVKFAVSPSESGGTVRWKAARAARCWNCACR